MSTTVHEIQAEIRNEAKSGLHFCRVCNAYALHTRPLLMLPFRCVASHGGTTLCDECHTFVAFIAKVVVTGQWSYKRFCSLCCEPESEEKQRRLDERRNRNGEEAHKPLDLNDPASIARALGASSFAKRR